MYNFHILVYVETFCLLVKKVYHVFNAQVIPPLSTHTCLSGNSAPKGYGYCIRVTLCLSIHNIHQQQPSKLHALVSGSHPPPSNVLIQSGTFPASVSSSRPHRCVNQECPDCCIEYNVEVLAEEVFQSEACFSADCLGSGLPEGWVTCWEDIATEQFQCLLMAVAGQRDTLL